MANLKPTNCECVDACEMHEQLLTFSDLSICHRIRAHKCPSFYAHRNMDSLAIAGHHSSHTVLVCCSCSKETFIRFRVDIPRGGEIRGDWRTHNRRQTMSFAPIHSTMEVEKSDSLNWIHFEWNIGHDQTNGQSQCKQRIRFWWNWTKSFWLSHSKLLKLQIVMENVNVYRRAIIAIKFLEIILKRRSNQHINHL